MKNETLKYTIIRDQKQYDKYCVALEDLLSQESSGTQDEIDLLTLLIEKWDAEQNSFDDSDPIEILKALMTDHHLKAKDLVSILDLSKGTVSKVLNYQKGLSKETIRKLANYFSVTQETFNKPYKLKNEVNRHFRNASLMNTKKSLSPDRPTVTKSSRRPRQPLD